MWWWRPARATSPSDQPEQVSPLHSGGGTHPEQALRPKRTQSPRPIPSLPASLFLDSWNRFKLAQGTHRAVCLNPTYLLSFISHRFKLQQIDRTEDGYRPLRLGKCLAGRLIEQKIVFGWPPRLGKGLAARLIEQKMDAGH